MDESTRETNILVFGASTAHGAWDPEGGGWVERLKRFLMQRTTADTDPQFTIYNLGVNGDTSRGLIERFERETQVRFVEADQHLTIFSIGTNDAVLLDDRAYQAPLEEFEQNIETLIENARGFGELFLTGLTPVEEQKTTPIPWERRWYYRNQPMRDYDTMLKKIATRKAIPFIDFYSAFTKSDYSLLLDDGLHPNSEGHKIMLNAVRDGLTQQGII